MLKVEKNIQGGGKSDWYTQGWGKPIVKYIELMKTYLHRVDENRMEDVQSWGKSCNIQSWGNPEIKIKSWERR